MKKTVTVLLIFILLTSSAALSLADEKKDHVCFRVLDSNKDGEVTFQEFEKFYENENEKFKDADKNEDGKLTHEQYHNILGHGSL